MKNIIVILFTMVYLVSTMQIEVFRLGHEVWHLLAHKLGEQHIHHAHHQHHHSGHSHSKYVDYVLGQDEKDPSPIPFERIRSGAEKYIGICETKWIVPPEKSGRKVFPAHEYLKSQFFDPPLSPPPEWNENI